MTYYLLIAGTLLAAFLLQFVFSMYQMRSFNAFYTKLRKMGRVAIGKSKGIIYAGCIAMFAVDENGIIIAGSCMEGVTFLAKFKEFDQFNGRFVGSLTKEDCAGIGVPKQRAVVNASSNYNTAMSGGEIVEKPGLLTRIANVVYGKGNTKKTCS
ncbi:MAG: transcriptional regulator GutM [Anaerostipes sp.]|nr:transcriptional regulator GutM [Anaerostipes sp.]